MSTSRETLCIMSIPPFMNLCVGAPVRNRSECNAPWAELISQLYLKQRLKWHIISHTQPYILDKFKNHLHVLTTVNSHQQVTCFWLQPDGEYFNIPVFFKTYQEHSLCSTNQMLFYFDTENKMGLNHLKGPATQNAVCCSGLRSLSAAECYILSRLF